MTTEINQLHEISLAGGPVEIRGALETVATPAGLLPRRLPVWTVPQHPEPLVELQATAPSGVRLVFRTAATVVELDVLTTVPTEDPADPAPDSGVFDLVVDGSLAAAVPAPIGNRRVIADLSRPAEFFPGPVGTVRFDGLADAVKDVEIWLPHWTRTELVALRADADVLPPRRDGRRVWLHHGSSISQCNEAESPTGTWPAIAARLAGVELVNVGLSGQCFLDPFTARSLRDAEADVISLKLGINLTSRAAYRLRTFIPTVHGFLDTVREGHPTTPILVISPIVCPTLEDLPGPTVWIDDVYTTTGLPEHLAVGALSLSVVRRELRHIVAERAKTDPNIHYLDGLELFGAGDAAMLGDGLHPTAQGYRVMGERFAELAFGAGGALAE